MGVRSYCAALMSSSENETLIRSRTTTRAIEIIIVLLVVIAGLVTLVWYLWPSDEYNKTE
jgi:hypothetical protein